MSYTKMLNDLISSPFAIKEETASASLLKFMIDIGPLIPNLCAEGLINRGLLMAALTELRDLEALRPGEKKCQKLRDALECIVDAKRALIRAFHTGGNPHIETIHALEASAERIRWALEPWSEKRGRRARSPQTPIIIALMAYFLKVTGNLHRGELSELVRACYRAAGSHRNCSEESLRKLWERKENLDLRRNWQPILMRTHKVHAPVLEREGHTPRSLRSGPGRFEPPKAAKSRVSASKYLN